MFIIYNMVKVIHEPTSFLGLKGLEGNEDAVDILTLDSTRCIPFFSCLRPFEANHSNIEPIDTEACYWRERPADVRPPHVSCH